jgi:hypothetical protein
MLKIRVVWEVSQGAEYGIELFRIVFNYLMPFP